MINRNKYLLLFLIALITISFSIGCIYGVFNNYDLTDYITSLDYNNNLFLIHIFIFIIFLFSTISLFGFIFIPFFISIISISIGYVIALFSCTYGINGFFYGLCTIIVNKGIYLLLIIYLFLIGYKYVEKNIKNIVGLNNDYIKNVLFPLLKKYMIVFCVFIVNDTFIYIFGNKILNYLTIML